MNRMFLGLGGRNIPIPNTVPRASASRRVFLGLALDHPGASNRESGEHGSTKNANSTKPPCMVLMVLWWISWILALALSRARRDDAS
jgi:hypothetical protein